MMDIRFVRREKEDSFREEPLFETDYIDTDPERYIVCEKYQQRFMKLCSFAAAMIKENDGLELVICERPWFYSSAVSAKFEYASMFSPENICHFYKGIALADSFEIFACSDGCFVINFSVYGTFEKRKE